MNLHRDVCKCWLVVALILMMIQIPLLAAQVESGKVVGSVRDATGAVLAGARITVTNVETNVSRSAVTNESGEYVVTELQPGTYTLVTERQGFKKAVQTPFQLNVNQVVRVDVTLAVGSVNETMTVTEAEPLVETDTSSIGQVIEENRVHELPLNGRNFMTLAYLSPGVNAGPTGIVQSGNIPENERDNGAIQVNGLTATNNNYLLNGFDNNEQQIGFELIEPPIDAIQEFKVQTSNMSADVGKGGAVVNVVLKSGTNQFHGSAFEFLRNSWMDAKNYFDDPTAPIPPFKRNEFGSTFGGPIIRDKTFFFVDYQGRRVRQSLTELSTVPALPISANFSGNVTDPRTGQSLTPAQLDPANAGTPNGLPLCTTSTLTSCLDPAAVATITLFPSPNVANGNVLGAANNFRLNPLLKNNQDSFDVRLDHQIASHDSFFATFSYGNVDALRPDPLPGKAGGGPFTGNINNKALMAGVSDVHSFSENKINEFKIGYMRYFVDAAPFFTNQPLSTQFGIPGIYQNDTVGGLSGLFINGFGFTGPTALGQALGNGDWFPEHLHENNYQLLDSFTYIKGQHSLKLGGDLRRRMHGFYQTQNTHGDFDFSGQFTSPTGQSDSTFSLADFLLGYSSGAFETGQTGLFGMRWWEFSSYFMDDFRATPKLTLNLGVRYDLYTPQVEDHNRLTNFDFATGEFVQPDVTPGTTRSGNVVTNAHNFSPRLGFAYTPWDSRTVVRGGYGIFYDLQADQNDAELAYGPTGLYGTQSISIAPGAAPSIRLFTGFETPTNPTGALPFPTLSNPSGRASAAFFNNKTTYIEEWNLNVEREFMRDTVLEVGYVGTHGVHLALLRDLNQATQPSDSNLGGPSGNSGRPYVGTVPNVAQIRTEGHDLSSITHSLQVRFEKRLSAGWSMLNSYTYQHTIGQMEEDEYAQPQNPYDLAAERGNVAPDYRHQFSSAWSYQLPFGPGRRLFNGSGPTSWIAGGWQLNGIVAMYSGQHFTPTLSSDYANVGYGGLGGVGMRPDVVGNPYDFSGCPGGRRSISCWFNPAAFAIPPFAVVNGVVQTFAHQFGDAKRGSLVGPAVYNTDFSVFKDFKFRERVTLQLRGEIFNLFNTPQFAPPNATVDTSAAGSISSTTNTSRQIQLVARITF
jgi:Carboxypeptidase regulatory-like domain